MGHCAAAALFTGSSAFAQDYEPDPVNFTGSYTSSFATMGTGTVAPAGWTGVTEAGAHNTFVPAGDYNVVTDTVQTTSTNPNFTTGTLTAASMEYLVPTQGSSTGKGSDIVNYQNTVATGYGTTEASESLGTDPSGNAATILELGLTNTTGQAIKAVNIAYDIDRFTTISGTTGDVPSGYPNSGVEEFPGYQLFYNLTTSSTSVDGWNPSTWVNVSSLNPTINMGTTGSVQVPNTVGITAIPTTTVSLASAWAADATIGFAWLDDNGEAPSPDQEIALNNVVIAAVPEPGSGVLGLVALGVAFTLLRLRRQRA